MTDEAGLDPVALMGLTAAAKLLHTDPENVQRWIDSGALRCVRVGIEQSPRLSRLMLAEWQRWLVQQSDPGALTPKRRQRRGG